MTQQSTKYKYVPIKAETKAELDSIGKKGQTYDRLVIELIKKWREEN